jgi:hypothetical protein
MDKISKVRYSIESYRNYSLQELKGEVGMYNYFKLIINRSMTEKQLTRKELVNDPIQLFSFLKPFLDMLRYEKYGIDLRDSVFKPASFTNEILKYCWHTPMIYNKEEATREINSKRLSLKFKIRLLKDIKASAHREIRSLGKHYLLTTKSSEYTAEFSLGNFSWADVGDEQDLENTEVQVVAATRRSKHLVVRCSDCGMNMNPWICPLHDGSKKNFYSAQIAHMNEWLAKLIETRLQKSKDHDVRKMITSGDIEYPSDRRELFAIIKDDPGVGITFFKRKFSTPKTEAAITKSAILNITEDWERFNAMMNSIEGVARNHVPVVRLNRNGVVKIIKRNMEGYGGGDCLQNAINCKNINNISIPSDGYDFGQAVVVANNHKSNVVIRCGEMCFARFTKSSLISNEVVHISLKDGHWTGSRWNGKLRLSVITGDRRVHNDILFTGSGKVNGNKKYDFLKKINEYGTDSDHRKETPDFITIKFYEPFVINKKSVLDEPIIHVDKCEPIPVLVEPKLEPEEVKVERCKFGKECKRKLKCKWGHTDDEIKFFNVPNKRKDKQKRSDVDKKKQKQKNIQENKSKTDEEKVLERLEKKYQKKIKILETTPRQSCFHGHTFTVNTVLPCPKFEKVSTKSIPRDVLKEWLSRTYGLKSDNPYKDYINMYTCASCCYIDIPREDQELMYPTMERKKGNFTWFEKFIWMIFFGLSIPLERLAKFLLWLVGVKKNARWMTYVKIHWSEAMYLSQNQLDGRTDVEKFRDLAHGHSFKVPYTVQSPLLEMRDRLKEILKMLLLLLSFLMEVIVLITIYCLSAAAYYLTWSWLLMIIICTGILSLVTSVVILIWVLVRLEARCKYLTINGHFSSEHLMQCLSTTQTDVEVEANIKKAQASLRTTTNINYNRYEVLNGFNLFSETSEFMEHFLRGSLHSRRSDISPMGHHHDDKLAIHHDSTFVNIRSQ